MSRDVHGSRQKISLFLSPFPRPETVKIASRACLDEKVVVLLRYDIYIGST